VTKALCRPQPDAAGLLTIEACCPWVDTGIDVVSGQTLWFEASGRWVDALIPCGPAGFRFNPLGFLGRRRSPRHNWFALIGGLDEDEATLFLIGPGGSHRFERSGRLSVFANDDRRAYGNNRGRVLLRVSSDPPSNSDSSPTPA
jgi:hypothetical protein